MKKNFDCVEMKHKAARAIYKEIAHLSKEEELKFWRKKFLELKKHKEKVLRSGKLQD